MDSADEWWKVEISDDVKHRSEEKIISGSSESLQKNNDSETNNAASVCQEFACKSRIYMRTLLPMRSWPL